jgi:fructose-1,6-bisphosphatase/inositol monophosphatase family enzyme
MEIETIAPLLDGVRVAGARALAAQQRTGRMDRGLKGDGSVVTEMDKWVEEYLLEQIVRLYPGANIVAEESTHPFDPELRYTFAVDPIDGTEVYSMGLEGWCVSVGLLAGALQDNRPLQPVAGILFAPRLGLLFFADVGQPTRCFGHELAGTRAVQPDSPQSGVMVSSGLHRELDLSAYPGKARGIGTAALHFCFPLLYADIVAAIQHRRVFAWDLAAAHALNRAHGLEFEHWSGAPIDYAPLLNGSPSPDIVVSGPAQAIAGLKRLIARRS